MESFFTRYRNALVLIVVLVAQLLALAIQARRPAVEGSAESVSLIRYAVVMVVTPPERLVRDTGLWFRSVWYGYIDLIHVRRRNAGLQKQLARMQLEQAAMAQDAAQGQRLQRMLGFREHYINKTLPAQVIGTGGADQSQVLYIDKGLDYGLQQDMPVITADGIVGKVKDVFPHTSQVLLLTDPTSGVGVILQTTRIRGILRGRAWGQLQVADISPDSRVKAGEPIVTSGGDQIFPRGLAVGTVEKVVPDPDHDPLVDVLVKPAAKLSQLEEVLVVTNLSDTPSAQSAKDLEESEAEQKRASDILAERLPSLVDPNAPADTNPPPVDAAGNPVRQPAPPQPIHSDRFSPGAEPDAAQMTPGHRWAKVEDGTEESAQTRQAPPPQHATAAAATTAVASKPVNGAAGHAAGKTPIAGASRHAAVKLQAAEPKADVPAADTKPQAAATSENSAPPQGGTH
ncbi:MAG TPA: rod shape-determining protein MreC [Chthonomonadales bacterium]|nr:rod shape-determining protein MreC [Chthonomonadales bacterium]